MAEKLPWIYRTCSGVHITEVVPTNLAYNGCLILLQNRNQILKMKKIIITVEALINAPTELVWKCWTSPEDIVKWNHALDDWHTTRAENDLQKGGKFLSRMEAKDGSMGFDFWGIYDLIVINNQIDCTLGDGRKMKIIFTRELNKTKVVETFEAESTHPVEMQQGGWQAILNNFKKYTESAVK